MPVEIACGNCGDPFGVEAEWAGLIVQCPHCESAVQVPEEVARLADAADDAEQDSTLPPFSGTDWQLGEANSSRTQRTQPDFSALQLRPESTPPHAERPTREPRPEKRPSRSANSPSPAPRTASPSQGQSPGSAPNRNRSVPGSKRPATGSGRSKAPPTPGQSPATSPQNRWKDAEPRPRNPASSPTPVDSEIRPAHPKTQRKSKPVDLTPPLTESDRRRQPPVVDPVADSAPAPATTTATTTVDEAAQSASETVADSQPPWTVPPACPEIWALGDPVRPKIVVAPGLTTIQYQGKKVVLREQPEIAQWYGLSTFVASIVTLVALLTWLYFLYR